MKMGRKRTAFITCTGQPSLAIFDRPVYDPRAIMFTKGNNFTFLEALAGKFKAVRNEKSG